MFRDIPRVGSRIRVCKVYELCIGGVLPLTVAGANSGRSDQSVIDVEMGFLIEVNRFQTSLHTFKLT